MKFKLLYCSFICFFFFFLYFFTLSAYPNWGDSAKLIIFTRNLNFSSDSGHHNLLLILYYPFILLPSSNLALKVNFANMFYSTLTLCIFFLLLIKIGNSVKTSCFLTLCFGISHLFWHLSVITESYNLMLFFLILLLLMMEKYKENHKLLTLSLAAFFAGLSLQVNLISLPLITLIFILHLRKLLALRSKILVIGCVFFISLLPILLIVIKDIKAGKSFYETVFLNFFQQKYRSSLNIYAIFDVVRILKIVGLFLYQFPFLLCIIFNYLILSLLLRNTYKVNSSIIKKGNK